MSSYHISMSTPSAVQEETSALDHIRDLEDRYLLQNYARYPLLLERGKGSYVYDTDGKRYLDFITGIGVNALGHAHPRITESNPRAGRPDHSYLESLLSRVPGPARGTAGQGQRVAARFFCNSGTEGMEGAIKMIRSHGRKIGPEKIEIIRS